MFSSNRTRISLHVALLSSAALVVAPAHAQDEPEPPVQAEPDLTDMAESAQGETIIVTGSRIARRDLTSTSPLAVVQNEEFTLSGAVNVEQVINTLPQVLPGLTSFSNNPGGGIATLNLRGLGAQRNLVLVNGRRYIFFDANQVVDLNSIPQFLIDSVDVVTGGASAVYGSDALAGVVNFRLRTDLDGVIAGAQYNVTEEGDGARYNAYMAIGTQFADGRGHVAAYAEYYNRGSIMQADREFSFFALGDNTAGDALIPLGSAGVPQGRFAVAGTIGLNLDGDPNTDPTSFPIASGTNYAGDGAFFAAPGASVPYVGALHSYNYAPANYLMVPQERWTLGGYAEYEISPGIHAYVEATFINNRVANELAATPVTQNVNFDISAIDPFISEQDEAQLRQIAANQQAAIQAALAAGLPHPFGPTPAGTFTVPVLAPGCDDPDGAGPAAPDPATCEAVRLQMNTRTIGISSRNVTDDRNAFRVLAGLRGDLTDTLSYDVYYMFSRTRNASVQVGNVSRSAITQLAANGTCNVFGENLLNQECIDSISILAQNQDISQLQVAQASISGPLFSFGWAADPVAFAAGVEWRSMSGRFIPDTALSSGDVVGFNAGNPTEGAYQAREAFAELRIPIVQDGFIHRFELNGAARYSDYSLDEVGGVWTYAAGVELAPVRDITFRGQYQRAIRAPNVQELFGGTAVNFPPATDPCSSRNSTDRSDVVRQLCIATGVPSSLVFDTSIQPNAQIPSRLGGNPDLVEEVADTWTVGAVIQPRFLPRLSVTVDYYDIEIDNAIAPAAGGAANILNLCYFVIQDAGHPICQLVNRNPLNGSIEGGPFIIDERNANLGGFETNGVDVQVDYSQPLTFSLFGSGESRLNFFVLASWTDANSFIPISGLDTVNECAGRFGLICGDPTPEWKWSTRLSWPDGPVTTSFRWRRVGAVDDDDPDTDFVVDEIGSYDLFDLAFAFNVGDNLTLNMGINNLFDKDPPVLGDNQEQSNTYPGTYDVIGRDFFISANLRF